MTNDNNTRSKANAVFFSVIMVISMVAVGFAAAPAAAVDNGTVTFNDQVAESGSVTVDVSGYSDGAGSNASIVVTYENSSGTPIIAGINSSTGISSGDGSVSVSVTNQTGLPGDHTAHLFNQSQVSGFSASVDDPAPQTGFDTDTAFVATPNTAQRTADNNNVYDGSSVYQGEETVNFIPPNASVSDGTITAQELSGTAGNREGSPLQVPIPDDEDTGTYDLNGPTDGDGGFSVTVVEPRITTAEVQLNGNDVGQVATTRANNNGQNFEIFAEWNFGDAENLEVSVEDPNGDEITNEVINSSQDRNGDADVLTYNEGRQGSDGAASVGLDLSTEDAGEYTVVFEGGDDIGQDSVVQEYTIETTSQDSVSIETAEDSVTQGDNLQYTVSGGTNADFHIVAIEKDDLRDSAGDAEEDGVFRNVQDVLETGNNTANGVSYAYAVVEIDGTSGVGSIDSSDLDDSSVDLDVYEAQTESAATGGDITGLESLDDVSFDVNEGDITLNSPTDSYTVGSEVDINGTADSADEVIIFARDTGEWEPLDIDGSGFNENDDAISVDSDNTFEEEDVTLSQTNNIFAFEGSYDIGVVDTSDLDSSNFGAWYKTFTTSEFATASSARYTLNVESGDLTADFGTINGQISTADDQIDVNGTAAGQNNPQVGGVVVVFVDERGNTVTRDVSVDNDGTFEREDIDLQPLAQGSVSGHVISAGRDLQFGDGDPAANYSDASSLATTIDNFGAGQSSGDQIRSQILSNTVDESGSDDLIVTTTFRLNDPTISINNVYPEAAEAEGLNPVATGETLVVEGDTNRQSDNAAITFEMLTQEDESVASASVDEWSSDGQFSATIDTSDLETGTYILEADDGESTDRVNVEIVEERQTDDGDDGEDGQDGEDGEDGGTDGDDGGTDGDDGSTDGDDGDMDGDDGGSDGDDGGSDGGDGGTDDSTPGFGALVALVALIAAALLATRRDN